MQKSVNPSGGSLQPPPEELFDANGFLIDPSLWDQELASRIAQQELIDHLYAEHWRVIDFVRRRYQRRGFPPSMRQVCRELKLSRSQGRGLFGNCLRPWRIAGLPDPGDEAIAHSN